MAKDKKKKSGKKKDGSVVATFKSLGSNTLVADVVAAALVATAAALKDPNKARRFASEASDQLETLSKEGAERGSAMWQLALDVGRRALDSMTGDKPAKGKRSATKRAATKRSANKRSANKRSAVKSAAKPKAKTAAKAKAVTKPKAKAAAKPKAAVKPKAAAKPKASAKPKAAAKPKARRAAKKPS